MNLLEKNIKKLTAVERAELSKPIGTQDFPYPEARFVTNSDGTLNIEIGSVEDSKNPIPVQSIKPHEHVLGLLYGDMAIPSDLMAQREILEQMALEAKDRLVLILGGPGRGKSHVAKLAAKVADDRQPLIMDCGGRHMDDLKFETVIDFGEDYKTAIGSRVASGTLLASSIRLLEEQLPEALIKSEEGKLTGIDWDSAVQPRKKSDKGKETTQEAVERSVKVFQTVAENEGIPTQSNNILGMKKIPGKLKQAHDLGLKLILDEYTKSIEGSDDGLQTVIQYLNGEIDEVTVESTMKVNGREETSSYVLRRSDMKAGFQVIMTGNEEDDGYSTHALSGSAFSRITTFLLKEPLLLDWEHRISQILTGSPLSTLCGFFSGMVQDDAEEFGQMLLELRDWKAQAEGKEAQISHKLRLKNWESTRAAVKKIAEAFYFLNRIVDPASDLYDSGKAQNAAFCEKVAPEISASFAKNAAIDFRKFIKLAERAEKARAEVGKIDTGAGKTPRLNLSALASRSMARKTANVVGSSAEYGSCLRREIERFIGQLTAGKPELQKAVVKEFRERGVAFTVDGQQDTVEKLLNVDIYSGVGGIRTVMAMRDTLAGWMKKSRPELRSKAEEEIVPLEQAVTACEEISRLSSESKNDTPDTGNLVLLSDKASQVFCRAAAVDAITRQKKPAAAEIVNASDFLQALRIPALAQINVKGIWRHTISAGNLIPASGESPAIVQIAEGAHDSKIGITTLMVRGSDNKPVPMHVICDGVREKSLIVTDKVDDSVKADLGSDFTIVTFDDPHAEQQVEGFIKATLSHESRKANAATLERQLTHAFVIRAGDENKIETLAHMMTNKGLPAEMPVYLVKKPST